MLWLGQIPFTLQNLHLCCRNKSEIMLANDDGIIQIALLLFEIAADLETQLKQSMERYSYFRLRSHDAGTF